MSFIHECNSCQPLAELGSEASASAFCLMIIVVFSKANTEVNMGENKGKPFDIYYVFMLSHTLSHFATQTPTSLPVKSILLSFIYKWKTEAKTKVKIHTAGSMTGSLVLDLSTWYSVYLQQHCNK